MSGRVLLDVADEAGHVVGDQPADRAAGVHGGQHGAIRREDEAGGLEVARVVAEVGAGRGGDLERVGAVPDGEGELVPGFSAMREDGLLSPEADPAELAVTVMTALQGGLLLAQTTRDVRPLELALDMAIAHAGRYRVG
jgi:TetR/AcrR family transcriptional regulator, transcriptional repressor for nem operon